MTFNEAYFRRYDETDDGDFYQSPRLVVHIDEPAIAATTKLFCEKLPENGAILDLMSSWRSHLPTDVTYSRVAGLGMNAVELQQNPQLTDYVVQSLNQNPTLPYADGEFDGGMVTVSVQYLTNPVARFSGGGAGAETWCAVHYDLLEPDVSHQSRGRLAVARRCGTRPIGGNVLPRNGPFHGHPHRKQEPQSALVRPTFCHSWR